MERFLVAFRYGDVSVWVKRVGEGRGEMYLQSLLLGGGSNGWMDDDDDTESIQNIL